ncbi:transmembrane emp24 domain-containing protein [Holotrichia oblita]|uniref:Transmembrane emp24 domain-containing protein n=1 Tax=Holotrichia oblita TaxID=644536 RepID=A0ACB9SR90_HOLOL|nr:transmembrane emp24 domain-containing protein [Holotrichia oblita]
MDKNVLFILLIFTFILGIKTHEKQLTINVEPRKQDCFFERINEKQTVELDYQVIGGGHGDLDITFQTFDPYGRILLADYKKSVPLTQKQFSFELIVDNDEDDFGAGENMNGLNPEDVYELKIQDIQDIVNRVRADLNKIRQIQDIIKSVEARDRNIAEENFFKVTTFSFVQIVIMLFVGGIQVIMVRSLFDDNSRVHKIWKSLDSYR